RKDTARGTSRTSQRILRLLPDCRSGRASRRHDLCQLLYIGTSREPRREGNVMVGAPQAGKRILLIDDDFTTREVMSVLLGGDGYRVSVAANGAEALERLRSPDRPELILLDLKMPVMDGCSFCEH